MSVSVKRPFLAVLSAVALASLGGLAAGPAGEEVPRDFALRVQYIAGLGSPWVSWHATVSADGKVARTIDFPEPPPDRRTTTLTLKPNDLRELAEGLKAAKFATIPGRLETRATDGDAHIVRFTSGGKAHSVWVRGLHLEDVQGTPEGRRVMAVWSAVLRKIPSPNAEQTPAVYKPKP